MNATCPSCRCLCRRRHPQWHHEQGYHPSASATSSAASKNRSPSSSSPPPRDSRHSYRWCTSYDCCVAAAVAHGVTGGAAGRPASAAHVLRLFGRCGRVGGGILLRSLDRPERNAKPRPPNPPDPLSINPPHSPITHHTPYTHLLPCINAHAPAAPPRKVAQAGQADAPPQVAHRRRQHALARAGRRDATTLKRHAAAGSCLCCS